MTLILHGLTLILAGVLVGAWFTDFLPEPPRGGWAGFAITTSAALATIAGAVMAGVQIVLWITS